MKTILPLLLTLLLIAPALGAPKEIPKGSDLRAALFDLARTNIEHDAGQPVKFAGSMKQLGDWAFFLGTIVNASGAQIQIGPARSADTAILWKIVDSEWQCITYAVGITDVAYASWPDDYGAPEALIFPEG